MSSPTVLMAVITLLIPIPLVWQLKLRPAQRFGVIGVFMLGALDLIISVLRMYHSTRDHTTDLMCKCHMTKIAVQSKVANPR